MKHYEDCKSLDEYKEINKWRKPGTLSHDNSMEISQTENPLYNNSVLLTHLKIDACYDIMHCVFAHIIENWRATISLLAMPTRSGEITMYTVVMF